MFIRFFILFLALVLVQPVAAQERRLPGSNQQVQLSFAPLVRQVSPAVVNIYTKRTVSKRVRHPFANDPFFGQFFQDNFFGGQMRRRVEGSLGSGVILKADGLAVTNAHVIKGAEEITVVLSDGREYSAKLALSDTASDLAVLRIDTRGDKLPAVSLKASESLEVGDLVLAIGNPFGVGQTVTSGIVSAQGRSTLNINDFNFFIQTDAAINPGNSGGPLVTLDGKVVGINTAIYSRDGGSLGIGFAIPSEMVASVLAAEKRGEVGEGGVTRPWLGASAQSVTADIGESLALDKPWGALISQLHSASPLKQAGVKIGDVVQSFNGREIRDASEMKFRMATVPLGESAEFVVARTGQNFNFQVEAMAPPEVPERNETRLQGAHPLNGAMISNVNPAVSVELAIGDREEGVVVTEVSGRSRAGRVVQAGDVLLEINGREIEDVKDVKQGLKKPTQQGWIFVYERGGARRQVLVR